MVKTMSRTALTAFSSLGFFLSFSLLSAPIFAEEQTDQGNAYVVEAPQNLAGAIASARYVVAFTSQGPLVLSPELTEIPESRFFTSRERTFPTNLPLPQSGVFLTDDLALVQDARTGRLWILDIPRGLPWPGPQAPPALSWMAHGERVFFFEGPFLKELVNWEGDIQGRGQLLDLPLILRGGGQIQYLSWDGQSLWQIPFPDEGSSDLPEAQEWKIPGEWGVWEDFGGTHDAFWFLTPEGLRNLSGRSLKLPPSLPGDRKLFFSPSHPYLLELSTGTLWAPGQAKVQKPLETPASTALQRLVDQRSYPQALRMALENPLLVSQSPALRKALVGFGTVEKTLEDGQWKVALVPDISFRPASPPTWEGREGVLEEGIYVWTVPDRVPGPLGIKRPLLGVIRSGDEETWFNIP